jgi:hypothetical protein
MKIRSSAISKSSVGQLLSSSERKSDHKLRNCQQLQSGQVVQTSLSRTAKNSGVINLITQPPTKKEGTFQQGRESRNVPRHIHIPGAPIGWIRPTDARLFDVGCANQQPSNAPSKSHRLLSGGPGGNKSATLAFNIRCL